MANQNKRELTLTRILDAPRELVFKAWTDPKLIQQWWGPNGVINPVCEFDPRPGGKINIVMEAGPELGPFKGQQWPMVGEVKEINRPAKLVYTATAIMGGKPVLEHLVTVTFAETEDKTTVNVHIVVTKTTMEAGPALSGMEQGWNQQMDKMVKYIEARAKNK